MINMTTEEAIKILDPETRQETLKAIPVFKRIDTDQEACRFAVAALRAQLEAEKNEPLTPEELHRMCGGPVVISRKWWGQCRWQFLEKIKDGVVHCWPWNMDYADEYQISEYGKTWRAYRRKPKKDETKEVI